MASHPTWHVGDRNPAITDTVTIDGVAVDLTTKTTTFKMRAVGTDTTKVSAAVSSKDANGNWQYNWGASDLDTAGDYLVWVTVDMGGGALETVNEALISIVEHAPLDHAYLEVEEFKSTAELNLTSYADKDIRSALVAASRGIDEFCGRRFWLDPDDDQVRYYTPTNSSSLPIHDVVDVQFFQIDKSQDGTWEETWTENTDFYLTPLNAAADGWPYTRAEVALTAGVWFPVGYQRSVKVTGQFGWAAVPESIKAATHIVAARLVKISREMPTGIVSIELEGIAARISRSLPDARFHLEPYVREKLL